MKTAASLRLRLVLAGAVLILAALGLSGLGLALLFERHVERRTIAELTAHLNQVIAGLERDNNGALVLAKVPADPRFQRPLSGLYWQIEADGTTLRSRSLWDGALDLPRDVLPHGAVHEHLVAGPERSTLLTLERSVTLSTRLGGIPVRAAVALDRADITAASRAFLTDLVPYLVVLALFLIAAGWIQIAVGLRPLSTVRSRIAAIRAGRLKRLGRAFPAEVRPLAVEVDALLDAQDQQVARARSRAADLAHGLKTPLQVLSGDADRLRSRGEAGIADQIEDVAVAMRRHVDRELARARLGTANKDASAHVRTVAERVTAVARRTPAGASLHWSMDVGSDLNAAIDGDDLTEALGNLVDNAVRFARSKIAVAAKRDGDMITLAVIDDGPGIPEEAAASVTSRGTRLDSRHGGAGLGLAIVEDIVTAWQGRLELQRLEPGQAVTIILPKQKPADGASPATA